MLDYVEKGGSLTEDHVVIGSIVRFESEHVRVAWPKSREKRTTDSEGAVAMVRTLLESVCKHTHKEAGTASDKMPDLNKLYRHTAELLNLAPSRHT